MHLWVAAGVVPAMEVKSLREDILKSNTVPWNALC